MVRSPGYNSARRSRNIGTPKQGFKKRNTFDIPGSTHDLRTFYEKLPGAVDVPLICGSQTFTFVVEPTLPGFKYYVSLTDIVEVLKLIPEHDRKDIPFIVLRQPKRKERIFSPVWGRMCYWNTYARPAGTAIVIEAIPDNYSYRIDKDIGPAFAGEIEALREDGHIIDTRGKQIEITCLPEAIRNTQLYRTIPHEIGHHVQFETDMQSAFEAGDMTSDRYHSRPQREREAFADGYAKATMAVYRLAKIIPYPPLYNKDTERLHPEWFYFNKAPE